MSPVQSLGDSGVNRTPPLPSKNSLFCLGIGINKTSYDAKC